MQFLGKSKNLLSKYLENVKLEQFKNAVIIDDGTSLPAEVKSKNCIYISDKKIEPQQVITLIWEKGYRHILQLHNDHFKDELLLAAELIDNNSQFLSKPPGGGLFNLGQLKFSFDISSSEDKNDFKKNLETYIKSNTYTSPLIEALWTIADELFMNSVFDAPTNEKGEHLYAHLPRTTQINLGENKKVTIFVYHDNQNIIIGSMDPYGSFNESKFLKQFYNSYVNENSSINLGEGGAGIGCKMMFELSSSVYFVSKKAFKTVVFCKLPTYQNEHRKDLIYKNFHLAIS